MDVPLVFRLETVPFANVVYSRVFYPYIEQRPGYRSWYSDLLRDGRSGDRILVGTRFSVPVQTCLGAHSASYTMGSGTFPGVKRPGRGIDHLPSSRAEVKDRVELYLYSPSVPS